MKVTSNRFRIKCGVAVVVMAIVLLPIVDWSSVREDFSLPVGPSWVKHRFEKRQNLRFLGGLVFIIVGGVSLCFEFEGDPPPRKDPWEK
jgi:uncharacterized membrane protein